MTTWVTAALLTDFVGGTLSCQLYGGQISTFNVKRAYDISTKCLENWKGYFNAFHKENWSINLEMLQTEIQHSFWIFTSVAQIVEENHNCNLSASDGWILDRFNLVYKQTQCEIDVSVNQIYKLYFCCYATFYLYLTTFYALDNQIWCFGLPVQGPPSENDTYHNKHLWPHINRVPDRAGQHSDVGLAHWCHYHFFIWIPCHCQHVCIIPHHDFSIAVIVPWGTWPL